MLPEVIVLVLFSCVTAFASIMYFFNPPFTKYLLGENDPFEHKVFGQNLPFWQLMMLLVFVPAMVMLTVWLYFYIFDRASMYTIPFSDKFALAGLLFSAMTMVYGVGAHGTSVSISHYMRDQKDTKAFKTVEFYHHILSHLLIIVGVFILMMVFSLFEINHPMVEGVPFWQHILLIVAGLVAGISLGFVIIEGRGKYYGFPINVFGVFFILYVAIQLELVISQYPATTYFVSAMAGSIITMLFWRLRKGEFKETLGDFFHVLESENGSTPPSVDQGR